MLAVVFIAVYAAPIIHPSLSPGVITFLNVCSSVIWLVFAADLAVRVFLAERRWYYLATHPIDVLIVVLPALRPLRVLRVFTAGQAHLTRASRFPLIRTAQALAGAAAVLIYISALAVLDAERGTPDANIDDFGDALSRVRKHHRHARDGGTAVGLCQPSAEVMTTPTTHRDVTVGGDHDRKARRQEHTVPKSWLIGYCCEGGAYERLGRR